jgi:hypothetical protein
MSIFTKIFDATAGNLVDALGGVVDRFVTTGDEKNKFKIEAAALIAARDSELEQTLRVEIDAKARVIEAEMQSGDKFTKRARPSIVYVGLAAVGWNYVLLPTVLRVATLFATNVDISPMELPVEFWATWGGVSGTWIIGRSAERRATNNGTEPNKITRLITGS